MQNGGAIFYVGSKNEKGEELKTNNDAFEFFIRHSMIKFLSWGGTGVVFKCIFQPAETVISPYVGFRNNTFAQRINVIIVKFVIIGIKKRIKVKGDKKSHEESDKYISTMTRLKFLREVEMYNRIVSGTNNYLEPVSPTVLFTDTKQDTEVFGALIKQKMLNADDKTIFQIMCNETKQINGELGFIVMESAGIDGVIQELRKLYDVPYNVHVEQLLSIAIFELLSLAISGFIHGDHHMRNISVSLNYPNYFVSNGDKLTQWADNQRAWIFDFERSFEMNIEQRDKFEVLYDEFINYQLDELDELDELLNSLKNCLKFIYDMGLYYKGEYKEFNFFTNCQKYNWIIDDSITTLQVAKYVRALHDSRQRAIKLTKLRVKRLIDASLKVNDETGNVGDIRNKLNTSITWSDNYIDYLLKLKFTIEESKHHTLSLLDYNTGKKQVAKQVSETMKKSTDEKQQIIDDTQKIEKIFVGAICIAAFIYMIFEFSKSVTNGGNINIKRPRSQKEYVNSTKKQNIGKPHSLIEYLPTTPQKQPPHAASSVNKRKSQYIEGTEGKKMKVNDSEVAVDDRDIHYSKEYILEIVPLISDALKCMGNGLLSIEQLRQSLSQQSLLQQSLSKQSLSHRRTKSLPHRRTKSLSHRRTKSLSHRRTKSLSHWKKKLLRKLETKSLPS